MEAIQQQLQLVKQQRDTAKALSTQVAADRATTQTQAAQAVLDLADASAASVEVVMTFSLSLALATNAMLDYKSREAIKIYGKAFVPLDALFDRDLGALHLFL
jgi:hypothetical protein